MKRGNEWLVRLVFGAMVGLSVTAIGATERVSDMEQMMEAIRLDARQTAPYTGSDRISDAVLEAIRAVPRDRFVPPGTEAYAYQNRPLPIGHGQTISQPFIVALMTDLLEVGRGDRVLEIGTGSGYQAAVLAELGVTVYSIEIVPELAEEAAARLESLGYDAVAVRAGNGRFGWPEAAPFDAIIVTAVGEAVPPALVEQLREGGRLVVPLGPEHGGQMLVQATRLSDGSLRDRDVLPVQFVPLTGDR
ncbi:MAG: protein-L-isoaspartate(D-aspartate) O-methyltransferase [Pseudomonadales bacterium]